MSRRDLWALREAELEDAAAYADELARRLDRGPVYAGQPPTLEPSGRWRDTRRAEDAPEGWLEPLTWTIDPRLLRVPLVPPPHYRPPAPRAPARGKGLGVGDLEGLLSMATGLVMTVMLIRQGEQLIRRISEPLADALRLLTDGGNPRNPPTFTGAPGRARGPQGAESAPASRTRNDLGSGDA